MENLTVDELWDILQMSFVLTTDLFPYHSAGWIEMVTASQDMNVFGPEFNIYLATILMLELAQRGVL